MNVQQIVTHTWYTACMLIEFKHLQCVLLHLVSYTDGTICAFPFRQQGPSSLGILSQVYVMQ